MAELALEQRISRWEDQRAIKNLMGKYALTMLLEQRDTAFDRFWSQAEDVCLGLNDGWYAGSSAIRSYYHAQAERTRVESELLIRMFPEKLGSLPVEKRYGVGHLDNRPVSAPVIVVAGDECTAKGMWTSFGCYTRFDPIYGPQSRWNWSVYAVDFRWENGQWRIWHMRYLTEIDTLCGGDWTRSARPRRERPEFADLAISALPTPNKPETLHEPWSPKRLRSALPPLPQAYETFADTFSYGMGGNEI